METLKKLIASLKDGSIKEMIAEWKWILGYSRRYKKAIAFYMFLGIFSTVFGLISAVASQKLIDIVTGKQTDRLLVMAVVMVAMALFSLIFNSVISRVSLKISIDIQNDIQADIFEKIEDASWMELMKCQTLPDCNCISIRHWPCSKTGIPKQKEYITVCPSPDLPGI